MGILHHEHLCIKEYMYRMISAHMNNGIYFWKSHTMLDAITAKNEKMVLL